MPVLLVSGISGHLECSSLCALVGWPLASCAQVVERACCLAHATECVQWTVGNMLAPEAQRRHRLRCQPAPGATQAPPTQDCTAPLPHLPQSTGAMERPLPLPGARVQESHLTFQNKPGSHLDFS